MNQESIIKRPKTYEHLRNDHKQNSRENENRPGALEKTLEISNAKKSRFKASLSRH